MTNHITSWPLVLLRKTPLLPSPPPIADVSFRCELYWNSYLGQWQVWVKFADGCTSVVCDWLVTV
ncbi:hypothetical protein FD723_37530 (plasmid) [Nostoc sp. C052]|uniref:hypothetical protein n=1 Tax=Nostoc sp. C052 TaxID=2576902 RepID=UPI0015C3869D|nr:hypothetical protein [Nostoc sp. C052]QLE45545.1 hypothetical protein FD723_35290 [Nostoc sp. C052]QLE45938.1 hypothetical protein FD723_37530 [Nostoc sp. C052]